jgi:hypothetical protein
MGHEFRITIPSGSLKQVFESLQNIVQQLKASVLKLKITALDDPEDDLSEIFF